MHREQSKAMSECVLVRRNRPPGARRAACHRCHFRLADAGQTVAGHEFDAFPVQCLCPRVAPAFAEVTRPERPSVSLGDARSAPTRNSSRDTDAALSSSLSENRWPVERQGRPVHPPPCPCARSRRPTPFVAGRRTRPHKTVDRCQRFGLMAASGSTSNFMPNHSSGSKCTGLLTRQREVEQSWKKAS